MSVDVERARASRDDRGWRRARERTERAHDDDEDEVKAHRGQPRAMTLFLAFTCGACAVFALALGVVTTEERRGARAERVWEATIASERASLGGDLKTMNAKATVGASENYVKPFAGRFKSIGEWPESYMVPTHVEASLGKLPLAPVRLGNWFHKPNQDEINDFIVKWSSKAVNDVPHQVYVVPANGKAKEVKTVDGSPMFYNFVHVPKAGGTYFSVFMSHALEKSGEKHGYPYPMNVAPFRDWITLPLVDTSQNNVEATAAHYRNGEPAQFFATEHLREQYIAGKRLFGKGQYGMGMCDDMKVPCIYLTVLRDPVERYLSHYKYSCLNGAEGRAQWLDAWKEIDECPLDPIEFMDHLGPNLDWIVQIAPGTATNPDVHVAQAKANLASACVRYLLLERYEDGLDKMRATFADFDGVHDVTDYHMKNPSRPMDDATRTRYEKYMANQTIVDAIVERHRHMKQVYDFAVAHYDSHWASAISTC